MSRFRELSLRLRPQLKALAHLVCFVLAYRLAFELRYDFRMADEAAERFWETVFFAAGSSFIVFYFFGLYHSSWQYFGFGDVKRLVAAAACATAIFWVIRRLAPPAWDIAPRSQSIFLIYALNAIMLIGGLRLGVRVLREEAWRLRRNGAAPKRVFIIGAGDAGAELLHELRRRARQMTVVGFLDDDPAKRGTQIDGIPVLGPVTEARRLGRGWHVQEALIAIPSATGEQMRRIARELRQAGFAFKTLPGLSRIIGGRIDPTQIRSVGIEELLGRQPVRLDLEPVKQLVRGKVVLVTGAGGSIGAELCRQVLRFGPARLLLLERAENNLFEIHRELNGVESTTELVPCVAGIGDEPRMRRIFRRYRPQLVFHAAAYKHVPLMELNPCEAVKNNVWGTQILADLAVEHEVEAFIMISTDKAVEPLSVMGQTKRLTELYVRALGSARARRLVTVRFGNVLGSSGSMVPIFQEQIARGGPVTVTHPQMRRFFMTIAEAVQLVLEAATFGRGGEILVLKMGEQIPIVELAQLMIELSGLRYPEDIGITFTGVRPGEKFEEALAGPDEELSGSAHEQIFVVHGEMPDYERLVKKLGGLREAALAGDESAVRRMLRELTAPSRGARLQPRPAGATAPPPPDSGASPPTT